MPRRIHLAPATRLLRCRTNLPAGIYLAPAAACLRYGTNLPRGVYLAPTSAPLRHPVIAAAGRVVQILPRAPTARFALARTPPANPSIAKSATKLRRRSREGWIVLTVYRRPVLCWMIGGSAISATNGPPLEATRRSPPIGEQAEAKLYRSEALGACHGRADETWHAAL